MDSCDLTNPMFDDGDDCCQEETVLRLGEGNCLTDQGCEGTVKQTLKFFLSFRLLMSCRGSDLWPEQL